VTYEINQMEVRRFRAVPAAEGRISAGVMQNCAHPPVDERALSAAHVFFQ
jgi:hypothetical protein